MNATRSVLEGDGMTCPAADAAAIATEHGSATVMAKEKQRITSSRPR
jgi:hypothetical protein